MALLHQTKDLDDETCFHANQFTLKPSSKDVLKNNKSVMVPVFKVQEKFPWSRNILANFKKSAAK